MLSGLLAALLTGLLAALLLTGLLARLALLTGLLPLGLLSWRLLAALLSLLPPLLLPGLLAAVLLLAGTRLAPGAILSLLSCLILLLSGLLLTGLLLTRLLLSGLLLSGLLAALLPLLVVLLVAGLLPLVTAFHAAAKRFEVIGQLARAVERVFHAFSLAAPGRAAFGRLQVAHYFFHVRLDDALALARLLHPAVLDQLIVASNPVRDAIAADCAGCLTQFIGSLLPLATHAARRLIYVAFESRYLLGKRVLALLYLLLALLI